MLKDRQEWVLKGLRGYGERVRGSDGSLEGEPKLLRP
jgi:hypothetical protein